MSTPLLEQIIADLAPRINCKNFVGYSSLRELHLKMLQNQKAVGIAFPYEWFSIVNFPDTLNFTIYTPARIKRSDFKYFASGFLLIQDQLSQAFIGLKTSGLRNNTKVQMNHFPYPRYLPSHYAVSTKFMTYMMLVSFFYPCITISKNIVAEKERLQKAILNTMGFKNSIHWLAWYTKSIVLLMLCLLIVVIILAIGSIYEFSNLICLIIVLMVYIHSAVLFAFFVSSFCFKSIWAVLAALLLYFATALPFVIVGTQKSSLASQVAASLGLNSALLYILDSVATLELQSVGIQWYTMAKTASYGHKLSIVAYMLIMFAVGWIELIICLYIEGVRPGELGVPQAWYYPCQKRYWCPRRYVPSVFYDEPILPMSSKSNSFSLTTPPKPMLMNPHDRGQTQIYKPPKFQQVSVEVKNICKTFGYREVVKDVSFNMYENEITALLGHNGAGKTTIILMLCGMLPPTYGTAIINGFDIVADRRHAKTNLGICPQHSVLFKGLSVKDHIYFFSRVKGYQKTEARMESELYIGKLNLVNYRKREALKLSGGNQRRLSLACALCGGSKLILCDEPSTGLDPRGRHDLWRLLQKEKRGRTVLMTTHLVEEGEILGDRIGILTEGRLRCYGPLGFLKQTHNTSYTLSCEMAPKANVDKLTEMVKRYVNTATFVIRGSDVNYKLPRNKIDKFADLFRHLENNKNTLDIVSYGLMDSGLEEVILNLDSSPEPRFRGGSDQDEDEKDKVDSGTQTMYSALAKTRGAAQPQAELQLQPIIKKKEKKPRKKQEPERRPEPEETRRPPEVKPKQYERIRLMVRRKATCMSRWRAMMIKKVHYTAAHVPLLFIIMIIPILYFFLVLVTGGLEKDNQKAIIPTVFPLTLDYYNYDDMIILLDVGKGLNEDKSEAYKDSVGEAATVQKVPSVFSYLFEARPIVRRDIKRRFVCGASFNDSSVVTAWFNSDAFEHSAPIALNLVYIALGKAAIGSDFNIYVSRGQIEDFVVKDKAKDRSRVRHRTKRQDIDYADYPDTEIQESDDYILEEKPPVSPSETSYERPPPKPHLTSHMPTAESALVLLNEKDNLYLFFGAVVIITAYLALALSIFGVFVTEERVNQIKWQHEIQGISHTFYWLSHLAWDFLIFTAFMLALTLALYKATIWYQVLIILLLIGFACLPFVYVCSLMFRRAATALPITFTILVITGGILFSALYLAGSIFGNSLRTLFGIFPMFVGAFGLFKCLSWSEYCEREIIPSINDLECNFGCRNVFCACKPENNWIEVWLLLIHGFFWVFFLWISPYARDIIHIFTSSKSNRNWNYFDKDNRVLDEERRVALIPNYEQEEYPLIVDQVKKNYCRTKAVRLVSFAIKPGECFGLLGASGAGKTSIFRMIVAESRMSAGNIYVKGNSLRENRNVAKKEIGYCPQFDHLHGFLTGRQTLKIYCLLMGVPKYDIKLVIEQLAYDFGFLNQLDQKVHTYSGGTRRKLSLALALNGGSVVVMDEPNNGVDPSTRNYLSHKIESACKGGRAVLLTTTSLDEVNAMCSRVGFLVAGEMSCIGSLQSVRSEVSNVNVLKVKLKSKPEEQKKDIKKFKADMLRLFPMAKLQETLDRYLKYHVYKNSATLSNLFYQMEMKRNEGKLEDYSISQASLEDILMELNDIDSVVLIDSDSSEDSDENKETNTVSEKTSQKAIVKERNKAKEEAKNKEKEEKKRKKEESKNKGNKKSDKTVKKRPPTSSESTDSDEFVPEKSKKSGWWK
ncbi:ATP-binding cassette sub-family A member 17 isoform X2 [Drosophila biarmipes]|uniref:ATP-binding cassette sub-family A member 17 isoform X2 n=1 Tax=Drosophila biarmipes TaxID=125945 RepID=UPI0007E614FA|nr:ATP-binding cassette sub-family A member 17 isoform X2 [Drosophila biarmipes]